MRFSPATSKQKKSQTHTDLRGVPWLFCSSLFELRATAPPGPGFKFCSTPSTKISPLWDSVFLLCELGQCYLWIGWFVGRKHVQQSACSRWYVSIFAFLGRQIHHHGSEAGCFFFFLMFAVNKIFLQRPKSQNSAKHLNIMHS